MSPQDPYDHHARRTRSRARGAALACAALALAAACVLASTATGASSSVTVTFDVLSSTTIDGSACQTGEAGATFGSVPAGMPALTDGSCTVAFGSTNDTSMLRLVQQDGMGDAMGDETVTDTGFGGTSTVNNVLVLPGGRIWSVGNSRVIRYSGDGGTSWTSRDVASGSIEDIAYSSGAPGAEHLIAVGRGSGGNGVSYYSSNGGASWTASTGVPALVELWGVAVDDNGVGWAAGASTTNVGYVLRTTDEGATWVDVTVPASCPSLNDALDIGVATNGVIWTVGKSPARACVSTDAGASWTNRSAGMPSSGDVREVAPISETEAWLAGHTDTVAYTDDQGATWSNRATGTGEHLRGIHAIDDQTAWVVGVDRQFSMTTDAGTTWNHLNYENGSGLTFYGIGGLGWTVFGGGQTTTLLVTPATWIADYDNSALPGDRDWTSGDMFGACLVSATNGALLDGATWTTGTCAASDSDPWHGIADTGGDAGATVAKSPLGDADATVALRFGVRTAPTAAPGAYRAPLTFEVIAPSA